MKIVAVVNANAGGLVGSGRDAVLRTIEERLRQAGGTVDVLEADGSSLGGVLPDAAADADLVVIGGGDGTVSCAVNLLKDRDTALGILPLGTMNVIARDLGLPGDLSGALNVIERGRRRAIDVASVNGRLFLTQAVLGVWPAVARMRESVRGARNPLAWLKLAGLAGRRILRSRPQRYRLSNGQTHRSIRTQTLIVSNTGLGQDAAGADRPAGGELAVYSARFDNPLDMLKFAKQAAMPGTAQTSQPVPEIVAPEFDISTGRKRPQVMLDGELMRMCAPLSFKIRSRALTIIGPEL